MADKVINADYVGTKIKEQDSQGMWDDFIVDGIPGHNYVVYHNDFTSWVPDEWTITEVNASTQTVLDLRNGVVRDTPAGAENDGSNWQLGGTGDAETTGEAWAPAAGRNLYFEVSLRDLDADQTDLFVGLHVQDTSVIASRGSDYIGFRVDDGDALIDVECASGSVSSSEANVATLLDTTDVKLGFKVSSLDKIDFYVNDVLVSTLNTNIPTALMRLSLCYLAGAAAANYVQYDYVTCAQSR